VVRNRGLLPTAATASGGYNPVTVVNSDVAFWLTKADQTALLKKQNISLCSLPNAAVNPTIVVIAQRPISH